MTPQSVHLCHKAKVVSTTSKSPRPIEDRPGAARTGSSTLTGVRDTASWWSDRVTFPACPSGRAPPSTSRPGHGRVPSCPDGCPRNHVGGPRRTPRPSSPRSTRSSSYSDAERAYARGRGAPRAGRRRVAGRLVRGRAAGSMSGPPTPPDPTGWSRRTKSACWTCAGALLRRELALALRAVGRDRHAATARAALAPRVSRRAGACSRTMHVTSAQLRRLPAARTRRAGPGRGAPAGHRLVPARRRGVVGASAPCARQRGVVASAPPSTPRTASARAGTTCGLLRLLTVEPARRRVAGGRCLVAYAGLGADADAPAHAHTVLAAAVDAGWMLLSASRPCLRCGLGPGLHSTTVTCSRPCGTACSRWSRRRRGSRPWAGQGPHGHRATRATPSGTRTRSRSRGPRAARRRGRAPALAARHPPPRAGRRAGPARRGVPVAHDQRSGVVGLLAREHRRVPRLVGRRARRRAARRRHARRRARPGRSSSTSWCRPRGCGPGAATTRPPASTA